MTSAKPLQKRNPFEWPPITKDGKAVYDAICNMCHELLIYTLAHLPQGGRLAVDAINSQCHTILCYIQDEMPESRDMSIGRQKLEEFALLAEDGDIAAATGELKRFRLWAKKAIQFYDVK